LALRLYYTGFDTLSWAVRYFLLGAVIVVPVWFIIRLLRFGRSTGSTSGTGF
jgi:hypothetical protein